MGIPAEVGDVVVRAGLVKGKNVLPQMIGEPWNHGGLAISPTQVHHVESNGYETIQIEQFFSDQNSAGGAVFRFNGPFSLRIRQRTANIAQSRTYKKIIGNPFSSADDLKTVNCNEFVHELFRSAISSLLEETHTAEPEVFAQLAAAYTDGTGHLHDLIKARKVEFAPAGAASGTLITGPAVLIGEYMAQREVHSPDVQIHFEGTVETRNLYPEEWAYSWNPFKIQLYSEGFYTVAVLNTYTPNSWALSSFFIKVGDVPPIILNQSSSNQK